VKHLRRRGKMDEKRGKRGDPYEALGANKKIYRWGKGQNIIHHYGNDIPMFILRFEI